VRLCLVGVLVAVVLLGCFGVAGGAVSWVWSFVFVWFVMFSNCFVSCLGVVLLFSCSFSLFLFVLVLVYTYL